MSRRLANHEQFLISDGWNILVATIKSWGIDEDFG